MGNFQSSNNYSEMFSLDSSSVVFVRKSKSPKGREVVDTWSADYFLFGRASCELELTKTNPKNHREELSISIHDHASNHTNDNVYFQVKMSVEEGLLLASSTLNGPRSMQRLPERKNPISQGGGVLKSSSFLYGRDTDRKCLIVILREKRSDDDEELPYMITVKHYFVAACCSHGVSFVAKIRSSDGGLSVELGKPSIRPKGSLLSMFDDVKGKGWCPDPIEPIPSQNKNPTIANINPGLQNLPIAVIGNGGYFKGNAVKLCLGDLLVMGSNPETASLHMQGKAAYNIPPPYLRITKSLWAMGYEV
ncbi:hypothetical protein glysoja_024762 [Glycine soja]|uniref:Uncharacterized protein n=1 Tax=Glycine soja TaxID=3848 RepID=A0A0B2Q4C0_GLYSO|nr:hypothetical protein glysoja_024762 [Glycine soja]